MKMDVNWIWRCRERFQEVDNKMLEDQVAYLLQRYLGNYVRGLSKEALKISVWKGQFFSPNFIWNYLPTLCFVGGRWWRMKGEWEEVFDLWGYGLFNYSYTIRIIPKKMKKRMKFSSVWCRVKCYHYHHLKQSNRDNL